jgi:hypothetical protein
LAIKEPGSIAKNVNLSSDEEDVVDDCFGKDTLITESGNENYLDILINNDLQSTTELPN